MHASLPSAARLAAAALILSALPAKAAPAHTDAELARDVRQAILGYPSVTVFDHYSFSVNGGVVTLFGSVQRPYRRSDVEARVSRVVGVRAVDNQIEVQPASAFDDAVRRRLFSAIYASDRFVHYGMGTNPSVRVLVSRGRVTLQGVVASRVDLVQLGMIARSLAPFGVDNRLVVECDVPREAPAGTNATT